MFDFLSRSRPRSQEIHEEPLPQQAFPQGIIPFYDPADSAVDIVFVHGLTGHRESTWKSESAQDPWPRTLLPSQIPNSRILTYGYDARVTSLNSMVSESTLWGHAWNMMTSLANYRESGRTNDRPIIFVCHSLGGLVCEQTLIIAAIRREQHLRNIFVCTRGIMFMGTPHRGAGIAHWAQQLAMVIGLVRQANPAILRVLRPGSMRLEELQDNFHSLIQSRASDHMQLPNIAITCFWEQLPLPVIGTVVPSDSATLPGYIRIGIHANHIGMTKFNHETDPGFIYVAGELSRWIRDILPPPPPPPIPPRVSLLGQMNYRENEHGWALNLGADLTRYDFLSGPLTEADIAGINDSRRNVIGRVNRIFRQYLVNLPEFMPGVPIHEITGDAMREISQSHSQSHVACFLIGSANFLLGMARDTNPEKHLELSNMAQNRFDILDLTCPELEIHSGMLLEEILRTDFSAISIRQVLRGREVVPRNE